MVNEHTGLGWSRRLFSRIDMVLPPALRGESGRESDEGSKARVFAHAWLIGISFGVVQCAQYLSSGLWGQAVLNGLTAAFGIGLLTSLRLGARVATIIQVSLAAPAIAFALGSIAQTPFDVTSLFYLAVVPLLASFVLGARAAIAWSLGVLVLGTVTMWLGFHGYTLPQEDPHFALTQAANFWFVLVMVAVVSIGVHQLRLRAFRDLDLANRAKSAFLANMSHEIRTPMNGVLGLTEVMLTEPMAAHQRERLELIQRSGEVLVALINDLLDLSRVEAGKLLLEQVEVDVRGIGRDVRALFASSAQQKGVDLLLEVSEAVPRCVRADPLRLRQVLTNLVGNAVKFTPSGRVRLSVEWFDGCMRFSVDDTGVGMPQEALDRVFRPFEQGDTSTTRRFGGSGLGLALSHRLVALMGGELTATSRVNVGTRFEFTLALERLSRSLDQPVVDFPTRGVGKVLVVDDNPINLRVAHSLVEKAGYSCVSAVNGAEALAHVQREPFDLVLMDCHMPEMDGFEATRRIRALPGRLSSLPVIALTASTMPEDREACRRAGMNELLAKPLSRERLNDALARFISAAPRSSASGE